ncbi:MAG: PAS domain-containing protein [Gemmatimonadetes bacterium]|nr:PAS domain-containing protein [Gemmatimonadota bacterium]
MAAPTLDSDHPGLQVLAEVASILASGLASSDALTASVGALRRGLQLRRCRLWLRSPDGVGFTPVTTPGDEAELAGTDAPVVDWIAKGPTQEQIPGGALLRLPLVHEDESLGALEVIIPPSRYQGMAHDTVVVVAKILAPVIAATELSQDLASEVAVRTREVEAQRSFAAKIIDSLPVGLYVIDHSYRIRAWNRKREAGTQGVSREDALGREVFDVLDRQPRELLKREFENVFVTGEIQQVEMESLASGEPRHYRITKIPMRMDDEHISHVITIGEDITEWHQAQQRLAQAEKLAALGQLAAGVMHEINNPLATILACSEALALRAQDLQPVDQAAYAEYVKIIDTEVQRCRRIVDGLLEFSRPKTGAKREVDVNEVVEQTLFLLKYHERFKRLTVKQEFTETLPQLKADPERLIQSFMALMLNAMDAMNSRGTLRVRTGINPGRSDELLIEFIDTGGGIRQEDLSKIFEPFYTTKPQGRGTGLGLSICYGIIAEHRGRIEVESQLGVGSNFKVFLPL